MLHIDNFQLTGWNPIKVTNISTYHNIVHLINCSIRTQLILHMQADCTGIELRYEHNRLAKNVISLNGKVSFRTISVNESSYRRSTKVKTLDAVTNLSLIYRYFHNYVSILALHNISINQLKNLANLWHSSWIFHIFGHIENFVWFECIYRPKILTLCRRRDSSRNSPICRSPTGEKITNTVGCDQWHILVGITSLLRGVNIVYPVW